MKSTSFCLYHSGVPELRTAIHQVVDLNGIEQLFETPQELDALRITPISN